MALALEGIKVIEIAQFAAAPMAGRLLADLGAEVIHIEPPLRGDAFRVFQSGQGGNRGVPSQVNYTWENYNRNKKSVALDLSTKSGRDIIHKLVAKADVFLNVLRPSELEKFGLEYETLSRINPRLIFASLTGYGRQGPDRNAPGFDMTAYWARTAIPILIAAAGFRSAFGDNIGGLMMAYGIMTALFVRERTGLGQEVDTSLLNTGIFQVSYDIAGALIEKKEFGTWVEENLNPLVGVYTTKDSRQVLLLALQPDLYWPRLCQVMARPELETDPRFDSFEHRAENRAALTSIIQEEFQKRTLDEWKPHLRTIPSAPVQRLLEVINDPQARANDMFVSFDHPTYGRIEVVAPPVKFSKTPATLRTPGPELGQHNEEVLLELGYTWEDIGRFREEGAIG